jgi:hypothetical protein
MERIMRSRLNNRFSLLLVGIIWMSAMAIGQATLLRYEFAPGDPGTPRRHWPASSRVQPDRSRANLVMVAHPRCPCTRASMDELAHIMAQARGLVTAHVLFYRPRRFPKDWERTALWREAAAIPGVRVLTDVDGGEARRFGVVTSGHVLLFDQCGRLLFSGGITGSRGHAGDNVGCGSVIGLLTHRVAARREMFVYGCAIRPGPAK